MDAIFRAEILARLEEKIVFYSSIVCFCAEIGCERAKNTYHHFLTVVHLGYQVIIAVENHVSFGKVMLADVELQQSSQ